MKEWKRKEKAKWYTYVEEMLKFSVSKKFSPLI